MQLRALVTVFAVSLFHTQMAVAIDTDGDGFLDLVDVHGFSPSAAGWIAFEDLTIEDLDGANRLNNVIGLSLQNNWISSIEPGDFHGLSRLRSLNLNLNSITSIEEGDFRGLSELSFLDLNFNQIASVDQGDFAELPSLSALDLSGNGIVRIADGAFSSLSQLNSLSLSLNRIESVSADHFAGLSLLRSLDLAENPLTTIGNGSFEATPNLRSLNLWGSQVESIQRDSFVGLHGLNSLWLAENQITMIEGGAFRGMDELRMLDLRGNSLGHLDLSRAEFSALPACPPLPSPLAPVFRGFCVDPEIASLSLDDARLDTSTYEAIISGTASITALSLVGTRLTDKAPGFLDTALSNDKLVEIRVDQSLFDRNSGELIAFAARPGSSVEVIGYGDANYDGVFDSSDLVTVFRAGEYEDGIPANSYWTEGDWNTDGDFDTSDLIVALASGQFERAVPTLIIPEPSAYCLAMLGLATLGCGRRRRL